MIFEDWRRMVYFGYKYDRTERLVRDETDRSRPTTTLEYIKNPLLHYLSTRREYWNRMQTTKDWQQRKPTLSFDSQRVLKHEERASPSCIFPPTLSFDSQRVLKLWSARGQTVVVSTYTIFRLAESTETSIHSFAHSSSEATYTIFRLAESTETWAPERRAPGWNPTLSFDSQRVLKLAGAVALIVQVTDLHYLSTRREYWNMYQ